MAGLTYDQIQRYSRHIKLKEIGSEGQSRLLASRVLVVGTGGLGSPCAFYLAAAGVGTLGLADGDVVERSNLQRQILHGEADLGRPKVDSAREKLTALNPEVRVITYRERLNPDNALDLMRDYEVVVDGADNFPARYLLSDACRILGKPLVHGSVFRFDGQVTVFSPPAGPCYRCLYPEPPPPGTVPTCEEVGVLGAVTGVIGSIQAAEAIKLLLGRGRTLAGRLLLFDALNLEFREVRIRRNAACPACGDHPTLKELIDYEDFCAGRLRGRESPSPADA